MGILGVGGSGLETLVPFITTGDLANSGEAAAGHVGARLSHSGVLGRSGLQIAARHGSGVSELHLVGDDRRAGASIATVYDGRSASRESSDCIHQVHHLDELGGVDGQSAAEPQQRQHAAHSDVLPTN